MIEVKGLHKYFKSFHALKGIDLHVKKGEVYGFIGHNGAGKSTTINILAGLSRPSAGQCIVNGRDVRSTPPGELGIGYLPEEPKFYPWLSAYETIEYLGNGRGHSAARKDILKVLEWVGLKEHAARRAGGFSRGMRQRLGIAAALIRDPELLFFDEPSSALDPEGRMDVLSLIKDLKSRGKTVFFSTHILDDVERVCDRVGILADGVLVLEKPLETLLNENISPVFDVELKEADETLGRRIKAIEGVAGVSVSGRKLSVTVKNPDRDSKALLSFLSEQNAPVLSFALRKNSLEDIFISEVNHNGYDAKH
jgi:ABC-2 type transport system ATP-binding protein